MNVRALAMAALAVLCLSACGGGGSGSGPRAMPDLPPPSLPAFTPPVPDPRVPVEQNNERWQYSTAYIKTALQIYTAETNGETWRPFVQPPVIRPAPDLSLEVLGALLVAVDAINAWLPYDQHLRIGEPAPFTRDPDDVATGEILLGESLVPLRGLHPNTLGQARGRTTAEGTRAGTILLTSTLQTKPLETMFETLVHELLHTLGLWGHLDPADFPDSLMSATTSGNIYLPVVDGLTLLMGYTQLRPDATAAEIAATDLGRWAEHPDAMSGVVEACNCAFGADLLGGHAVSWFIGDRPVIAVQDLGSFGTATWTGKMVGWTPDQDAVWSDLTIDVDLDSYDGIALQGEVGFDKIAHYDTGTQWGSGELDYDIYVADFYFRSENTTDGYVFGAFAGTNLEGAVGTLEHPELTGAFGGVR